METYNPNARCHTPGPPRPLINRPVRGFDVIPLEPGYPAARYTMNTTREEVNPLTNDPKSDRDNHSNQCNPNHDEYSHSRE